MGKLMQWQAWIRSCFVDRFCRHVYLHSIGTMMGFHAVKLWQNDLSLSQSHEYHHPDSLQLTNKKDGSKNHY
jgi:hypothetical protein